jgi:predicted SAM-dependent methyltransferase
MMSSTHTSRDQEAILPGVPVFLDARAVFANAYLKGEGIEIGALHQPLAAPPQAHVRYVDRMTTPDLRREYPELADYDLTEVDIVDDGERLATLGAESQDFIVANHFLEHTEDPVGTIETHLEKLKPGGVLFYAVPDKRFTFDFRRPVTPIEHMVADHEEGPAASRPEHFREWSRYVLEHERPEGAGEKWEEQQIEAVAQQLEAQNYSIHMHVWTQAEFLRLILTLRDRSEAAFDIEAAARVGLEFVVVLRKAGPLTEPSEASRLVSGKPKEPRIREEARTVSTRAIAAARERLAKRRTTP